MAPVRVFRAGSIRRRRRRLRLRVEGLQAEAGDASCIGLQDFDADILLDKTLADGRDAAQFAEDEAPHRVIGLVLGQFQPQFFIHILDANLGVNFR